MAAGCLTQNKVDEWRKSSPKFWTHDRFGSSMTYHRAGDSVSLTENLELVEKLYAEP